MALAPRSAVFFDKDGTLIEDVPYNVDPARIRFASEAGDAIRLLGEAGYMICVVSNQSGVGRGLFPEAALCAVERTLAEFVTAAAANFGGFYYCPHLPSEAGGERCPCRKPGSGLVQQAARELDIDLSQSWMVGDILDDIEAGHRAGVRTVLLDNGCETEWELTLARTPDYIVGNLLAAARVIVADARSRQPGSDPPSTAPGAVDHA